LEDSDIAARGAELHDRARPGLSSEHARRSEHGDPGLVAELLDPVLVPLGFASGQVGADDARGQVTFCRGEIGSTDGGCIDLVVELEATPGWRITDVRYWGFPSDRWRLDFDREARLTDQLAELGRSLPGQLT
jgi:hypothetical protein